MSIATFFHRQRTESERHCRRAFLIVFVFWLVTSIVFPIALHEVWRLFSVSFLALSMLPVLWLLAFAGMTYFGANLQQDFVQRMLTWGQSFVLFGYAAMFLMQWDDARHVLINAQEKSPALSLISALAAVFALLTIIAFPVLFLQFGFALMPWPLLLVGPVMAWWSFSFSLRTSRNKEEYQLRCARRTKLARTLSIVYACMWFVSYGIALAYYFAIKLHQTV